MDSTDPVQSVITALSSEETKPFSLPPTLAPGVVLRPELIARPDLLTTCFGFLYLRSPSDAVARQLKPILELSSALVNRPVTQAELDFHVENTSKNAAISRAGPPWCMALTSVYYLFWKRSADQLAPYFFRSPDESAVKSFISSVQRLYIGNPTLLKSVLSSTVTRLLFAGFGGYMASSSIAVSTSVKNMSTDPRLAQYKQELKEQDPKALEQRRRAVKLLGSNAGTQLGQEATRKAEEAGHDIFWKAPEGEPARPSRHYDNAPVASQSQGGDFFDDDDASPVAPESRGEPSGSAWGRVRAQAQSQPYRSSPSKFSKTNTSSETYSSSNGSENQDNTWQGSAWDRIRQQGPPISFEPQQRQGSSWDSSAESTASQNDRNREKAKFEQMLDAERKLGSDSRNESVWK